MLGELGDQRARQRREVSRRGHMAFRGKPSRIGKVAREHAELAGVLVHHLGEHVLGARDVLGQSDAGVVARLNDHAVQQVVDADLLADLDEHARAGHPPGLLGDRHLVLQVNLPLGERLENDICRHELRQTGRRKRCIRIQRRKFLSGLSVDDQIALRPDDRRRGRRHGGLSMSICQESKNNNKKTERANRHGASGK